MAEQSSRVPAKRPLQTRQLRHAPDDTGGPKRSFHGLGTPGHTLHTSDLAELTAGTEEDVPLQRPEEGYDVDRWMLGQWGHRLSSSRSKRPKRKGRQDVHTDPNRIYENRLHNRTEGLAIHDSGVRLEDFKGQMSEGRCPEGSLARGPSMRAMADDSGGHFE